MKITRRYNSRANTLFAKLISEKNDVKNSRIDD